MTTSVHRSLSDDSNSSFNKNIWVLGVCLIIVGSLGNNLGNNLVSLDHKQKQAEQAEIERQKREDAKEQRSEASMMVDLEHGGMTAWSTAGSDKGEDSSVTHPQSIKCEKGHDVHKIVGKHSHHHDSLENGHVHPETQHMCTICNLKELEREVDGWYRCHTCNLNKCAKCAVDTNSAKTTSPTVTATSVGVTDCHVPNGEVVVGKPEKNKSCSYRTIGMFVVIVVVDICTNTLSLFTYFLIDISIKILSSLTFYCPCRYHYFYRGKSSYLCFFWFRRTIVVGIVGIDSICLQYLFCSFCS